MDEPQPEDDSRKYVLKQQIKSANGPHQSTLLLWCNICSTSGLLQILQVEQSWIRRDLE
jgi:hypothetical protein